MIRTLILLPAVAAAAFALAACSSREDTTVGQKVDSAVASAKAGAEDAKQAATEAAKVAATTATDATITTRINAALVTDDKLKAMKIDVDTTSGRVLLKGTAPDAGSRERATTLAKAVEGVVDVENRLTLSGSN